MKPISPSSYSPCLLVMAGDVNVLSTGLGYAGGGGNRLFRVFFLRGEVHAAGVFVTHFVQK